MASLNTIKNLAPFPQSVSDQLKQVLSTGERQVKVFIQDRLLMHKTSITEKISKNKFPLLSIGSSKSTSINLGVPFMNKLRSAVEHRPARADELFREELYGLPHCFSVDSQMKCIMAARVQYKKDYHHVSNLSYQRHTETS